jgi:predicted nuclease of predicted toxin-antitoxin system
MNLSPTWLDVFAEAGWEAYHWSSVGDHSASDREILKWAADNGCIVFTHDLEFGALLASTGYRIPSVVQLRGHETSPSKMGHAVVLAVKALAEELEAGALVTIDAARARARILPLVRPRND